MANNKILKFKGKFTHKAGQILNVGAGLQIAPSLREIEDFIGIEAMEKVMS